MIRIGHGYDVHKLVEGCPLILGGIAIPYFKGLLGHSDADVVAHAAMDAIIGALCLGDIGKHFPDNDPAYKNADSMKLLGHCVRLASDKGYRLGNIDITVVAQAPKLAEYIFDMRKNIANIIFTDIANVNLKATTEENLGFTGEGLGMAAHAVCLLFKN